MKAIFLYEKHYFLDTFASVTVRLGITKIVYRKNCPKFLKSLQCRNFVESQGRTVNEGSFMCCLTTYTTVFDRNVSFADLLYVCMCF